MEIEELRFLTDKLMEKDEQIKRNEANLKRFFHAIPDMIFVTSLDLTIKVVNMAVHNVLGYSDDTIIGKSIVEVFRADETKIREIIDKILVDGTGICEIPMEDMNHTMIPVQSSVALSDWNGEPSLFFIAHNIAERLKFEHDLTLMNLEMSSAYQELRAIEDELRYRADEAERRETLLRSMCDNAPDMIWAKDINKKYIFANRSLSTNLLNVDHPNEIVGKDDMYFAERERNSHPFDKEWHTFGEICQDSDDIVMQTGEPGKFFEYGNVKGEFLYLDVHKAPFMMGDEMIGTVGCGRDITYEHELEGSLKNRVNFIESFMSLLPIPIFYKDIDGTFLDCNDAFSSFYGLPKDNIIGKTSSDLFPDIADKLRDMDKEVISEQKQVILSTSIYDNHWHLHKVLIVKTLHKDANNNPIGIIGAVIGESMCLAAHKGDE